MFYFDVKYIIFFLYFTFLTILVTSGFTPRDLEALESREKVKHLLLA